MSTADAPYSRDELISALEDVHREVDELFRELPGDALVRQPEAGVWSPAEHLIHLVRSVKAVADAMRMPGFLLAVLFGTSREPSRRFDEIRRIYQERLAQGGRATGRYVPPALDSGDPEATRSRALAGWQRAGAGLVARARRWREPSLDRYRLPHPLIGKLTVREMLFFTLYHDRHHLASVRLRQDDQGPTPSIKGTIEISEDDPNLEGADAAIRALFQEL